MHNYTMRISHLTVDKLGVKLYDQASAAIAELIANAYDADATEVTIKAPMGKLLAHRRQGQTIDQGFTIEIEDNGIGMTPDEMQNFFLVVGAERRKRRGGETSKRFDRKVMGRKGIGKLAPFGICKEIEVLSAGGEKTERGYQCSHIILNYDDIIGGQEESPYEPKIGQSDHKFHSETGTKIILRNFSHRHVPKIEDLSRQIARRFGLPSQDWEILLQNNTDAGSDTPPRTVEQFELDFMENTKIKLPKQEDSDAGRLPKAQIATSDGPHHLFAGFQHENRAYPVHGWAAYSKIPYTDELMAGIRIYCRGKIVAQTPAFNQKAGFTGEYDIRSYLIGELHADWLDDDEDLIQTDRRDILWSHELGIEFQKWGQSLVKAIGKSTRDPLRRKKQDVFYETGEVKKRINQAYPKENQKLIRESAKKIADLFGASLSMEELKEVESVRRFVDISIDLAPHFVSSEKLNAAGEESILPIFIDLLVEAGIADAAGLGKVASQRVSVIKNLEKLIKTEKTKEIELQNLITQAPWLINPAWTFFSSNVTFSTLKSTFEIYYKKENRTSIKLTDFPNGQNRADFVLSNHEGKLQIIEIKRPGKKLTNVEMGRIVKYHETMQSFLKKPGNEEFSQSFHDFHITLVCDSTKNLTNEMKVSFNTYISDKRLTHLSWESLLLNTRKVHQDFLDEANRPRKPQAEKR